MKEEILRITEFLENRTIKKCKFKIKRLNDTYYDIISINEHNRRIIMETSIASMYLKYYNITLCINDVLVIDDTVMPSLYHFYNQLARKILINQVLSEL